MIRAKIVGAGGYGGIGILTHLLQHPEVEIVGLTSITGSLEPISKLWPHLEGYCDMIITPPEEDEIEADIVFCATPDGIGMTIAEKEIATGARVIDYSGDFRAGTIEEYVEYANRIGRETYHDSPKLLEQSAYGVPELHRDEIAQAQVVANPGCFAVGTILGYAPAIKEGLIDPATLITDAKTGISGAGKSPKPAFHYPEAYDNMFAYRVGKHQHVVEVERELTLIAEEKITLLLNTQVVPVCRGIMASCYGRLTKEITTQEVVELYRDFYKDSPMAIITDTAASNNDVRGSNRFKLWPTVDPRTGTLLIMSHVDNLEKGQAGSACQNMNVMFGFDESLGLNKPAKHP